MCPDLSKAIRLVNSVRPSSPSTQDANSGDDVKAATVSDDQTSAAPLSGEYLGERQHQTVHQRYALLHATFFWLTSFLVKLHPRVGTCYGTQLVQLLPNVYKQTMTGMFICIHVAIDS